MNPMVDTFAQRLAMKLKEVNPEETASVEVMKYALIGIIHNGIIILTALIAGLFTGHLLDTLLAIICFIALRFVSGGFHFKSSLACFVFSSVVFVIIPLIPAAEWVLVLLNSVSLLLALVFSPANIEEHIRVHKKYFVWFKVISVAIILCNYLILTPVTTWALFAQSLSLIHLKKER
jgi:accessory gene regulator B